MEHESSRAISGPSTTGPGIAAPLVRRWEWRLSLARSTGSPARFRRRGVTPHRLMSCAISARSICGEDPPPGGISPGCDDCPSGPDGTINPRVNAIVTLVAERALKDAAQADEVTARGGVVGVLHGLPVAHKDLVETAGIRTTRGSLFYRDYVPTSDALIVTRIRAAGAITCGKTNTPEFGAGSQTFNGVFERHVIRMTSLRPAVAAAAARPSRWRAGCYRLLTAATREALCAIQQRSATWLGSAPRREGFQAIRAVGRRFRSPGRWHGRSLMWRSS